LIFGTVYCEFDQEICGSHAGALIFKYNIQL
jgi:hypothetical protein